MAKIIELRGCESCVLLAEGYEDEHATVEQLEEFDKWQVDGFYLTSGEEKGFSWNSCHVCKSNLGGDRYEIFAVKL